MKKLIPLLFVFVVEYSFSQVPAELAANFVGKKIEISGKVLRVYTSMTNKGVVCTRLYLGNKKDVELIVDMPAWDSTTMKQNYMDNIKAEEKKYKDSTLYVTGTIILTNEPFVRNRIPYMIVDTYDNVRYK